MDRELEESLSLSPDYYAVRSGRVCGIYSSRDAAVKQILNKRHPELALFHDLQEADKYLLRDADIFRHNIPHDWVDVFISRNERFLCIVCVLYSATDAKKDDILFETIELDDGGVISDEVTKHIKTVEERLVRAMTAGFDEMMSVTIDDKLSSKLETRVHKNDAIGHFVARRNINRAAMQSSIEFNKKK